VPLGLHLGDAFELDPELVTLRRRELFELADSALERRTRDSNFLAWVARRI
jgi:hypothetical protein